MKRNLLSIVLVFMAGFVMAQTKSSLVINQYDTVVFNVLQAVYQGGYVEFPVFFRSDDTINALDFSFKFNTACFTYDTVIKLASYLTVNANYDSGLSRLIFTSYSLQRITNDTPLVKIRLWDSC